MVLLRALVPWAVLLVMLGCTPQPGTPADSTAASGSQAVVPDESLYAVRMKACLEQSGYTVEVTVDGGVSVEYAPPDTPSADAQKLKARYDAAHGRCLHETGYDVVPSIDPAEEYRLQTAVDECLRQRGVPVKSPTYEEFLAGRFSDRESVLPADPEAAASLLRECQG